MPWVTVAAHSASHSDFLKLDEAQRVANWSNRSRNWNGFSSESSLFSFPHGRYNESLVDMARTAGYRRVFTISPTWAFQTPGEFVTGRVAVDSTDWPTEFWLKNARLRIAGRPCS